MYDYTPGPPCGYVHLVDALAPLLDGVALYTTSDDAGLVLVRCSAGRATPGASQDALLEEMRELAGVLQHAAPADSYGVRMNAAEGDFRVLANRYHARAVRLPPVTLGRSVILVVASRRTAAELASDTAVGAALGVYEPPCDIEMEYARPTRRRDRSESVIGL